MRYLLMICGDENAPYRDDDPTASIAEYIAFGEEMTKRGVLRDGARLRPTTEAVSVQVHDGKVATTDGPFAETKEQIGGYYLVECKDRAEAIEIASKIPGARHGTIEVRPVWEM